MSRRLTVLGWHNVEATWCFPNRRPGARGLEAQLRKVRRAGNVVPLGESLDKLRAGEPLPPRAVALCWDDGYRDNLDLAVPILEKLGLPGTFFLVPGLLDGERLAWWEVVGWAFARTRRDQVQWRGQRLPTTGPEAWDSYTRASDVLRGVPSSGRQDAVDELVEMLSPEGSAGDERMFLDWQGAHRLIERGFEVGSHTSRHVNLAVETPQDQVADLRASRVALESELDVEIRTVAYPFGQRDAVSAATLDAAVEAGYAHGLTTQAGCNGTGTPATGAHRFMLDPAQGFTSAVATRALNRLLPGRGKTPDTPTPAEPSDRVG